jgi:pyruvate,orthophosphate dikinase
VQQELFLQETPLDGLNEIYGEYLINAQGEDVVAGTRTPQYITKKARQGS